MSVALGLLRACHPGPSLAVTAFAVLWGALAAGLDGGRLTLLGAAVLSGQLSIGWCNDVVDAGRDRAAGRADKPVVGGLVPRRGVAVAAGVALLACVGLSLALGPAAGAVHLLAVASGWAYDLGVKATWASPLPYAVSFGLLPAVATLAADPSRWPPAAVLVAAALLGVAAHFANTVPDADADALTGVRGLPQRWGPRVSVLVAAAATGVAATTLLLGSAGGGDPAAPARGGTGVLGAVVLVTGVLLAVAAAVLVLRAGAGHGRRAFWLVVASAGVVVVGFLLG